MDIRKYLIAAALTAVAASSPAAAAPVPASKDSNGKALILIPLTITKVNDLDFGSIIPSSASGTVTIPADGSSQSFTGGVIPLSSTPGLRALFAGAGTPGQQVSVFLAPPATLKDSNGDTMAIAMNLESTSVIIDSTHAFFVGVGGTVTVGANQPEGDYNGTFTVLAQYN